MKRLLLALALGFLCVASGLSMSQTGEFRTITLSGTADTIIDSSLTASAMDGKRAYINGIYWWYDNAANTNQMFVEVVRGGSSIAVQGSGRNFKYSEAMTSSGIKGTSMPMNVTTGADSTLYFVIAGASSDSLYMVVSYKLVGK